MYVTFNGSAVWTCTTSLPIAAFYVMDVSGPKALAFLVENLKLEFLFLGVFLILVQLSLFGIFARPFSHHV
jgi:hypothetical protein